MNKKQEKTEWEDMREALREEFEELFPKDEEATMGIRPSKSGRSPALVLWAKWELILRKAIGEEREKSYQAGINKNGEDVRRCTEDVRRLLLEIKQTRKEAIGECVRVIERLKHPVLLNTQREGIIKKLQELMEKK